MAAKLITYDLNRETIRPNIVQAIRDLGDYVKLSESSYVTNSNLTPSQIYQQLSSIIDTNDRICIATLTKPYYGWLNQDVIQWLERHL